MTLFDNSGTIITHPWAGPFNADPESCVVDAAGNIYVGQADGTGDILKFAPDGTFLDSFDVPVPDRGSDWIDLSADQCTMLYAGEGDEIFRYDVCTDTSLLSFASGLTGGPCYGLRIRSNDQVLVACSSQAHLLNADGTIAQTYLNSDFAPAPGLLFALNLDPDGTSFWTADLPSGQIYHMDIATGAQLFTFNAAAPVDVAGLAIFGEPTVAVCPVGTHGTPPNCIPDMVGGELISLDSTALFINGIQSSAIWMLPVLAGIAGTGAYYIRTRMNKD
jgi:outer membrane protein assembly factor BamB